MTSDLENSGNLFVSSQNPILIHIIFFFFPVYAYPTMSNSLILLCDELLFATIIVLMGFAKPVEMKIEFDR